MITRENFDKVLVALGFSQDGAKYFRQYGDDYENRLVADFGAETLSYPPSLSIQRETVTNFSDHENFVTFECVARLLAKGYVPAHIELESPIPGGHGSVIGYNDIRVKDNDGKTFLLIECKTADEFSRFWKQTLFNGSQLFNYFNTYREAEALCLYASDWTKDGGLSYVSHIISMRDNEEYLQTNKELKSFKSVGESKGGGTKDDYFDVWAETYKKEFDTAGVFEEEIEAYSIGKLKYTVRDLIEPKDNSILKKKDYEFATIMRRHNVGSHENAFDKLVNLFLAKIVDESTNADELQFRWRGVANDDYFRLQDRLQKLYKEGMEKFLGEEVTYIDQSEVSDAFHFFKNDPDATRDKILSYFRQLKFFTNSDFAFLDVHNETLFYKNAAILKEMVQMLQDMKLKTDAQNQFLGDLFEHFLDQGVKQNEGQYLTPLPIVKFLVSSLPLADMVNKGSDVPRAIDYACGAGHFLTEYAEEIKRLAAKIPGADAKEYIRRTIGIEKEYRLSKVAKVSAFMYGHEEIQIVYGDALAAHENIKDGSFSVLVANPPYSVKGFLDTLSEAERARFTLAAKVGDISVNNSIETFFVERAKQLLAGGGVAAIILPSSILNNKDGIYTGCREIILKYFHIIAIAQFGGGTFGKTPTETVTLFLRRRNANPDAAEHYKNRVEAWFHADTEKNKIFEDSGVIDEYCAYCKIDSACYRTWLAGGAVPNVPIFAAYEEAAKKDAKYRRIEKKKITAKYMQKMKNAELDAFVENFTKEKEKEKLYYFMLASDSASPVVVIKCSNPNDSRQRKLFLGYEWSDSKENKGIQYIGTESNLIQDIATPLFNPKNLGDKAKINTLIRGNFEGKEIFLPEDLKEFVSVHRLVNLMDFDSVEFGKVIAVSAATYVPVTYTGEYALKQLGELVLYGSDRISITDFSVSDYVTTDNMRKDKEGITAFEGMPQISSAIKYKAKDVLISNIRPYLKKVWFADRDGGCSPDVLVFRSRDTSILLPEYLFVALRQDMFFDFMMSTAKGMKMPRGDKKKIMSYAVPLPSLDVQKKIVDEFNNIDEKIKTEIEIIDNCASEVKAKFEEMFVSYSQRKEVRFDSLCEDDTKNAYKFETSDYLPLGEIPIIDQGDRDIAGYRDSQEDKPPYNSLPCLVFGDHTERFKFVERPFYLGADGTKVLVPKDRNRLDTTFLFYMLQKEYAPSGRYERHYKYLRETMLYVPPIALQKEFAAYVQSADEKKNAAVRRKEELLAKRERLVDKYFR